MTWAAFRDSRRSGAAEGGPGLAQVADELAVAVGKQWSKEAEVRRLNDPYPLPVSWAAADGAPDRRLGVLVEAGRQRRRMALARVRAGPGGWPG